MLELGTVYGKSEPDSAHNKCSGIRVDTSVASRIMLYVAIRLSTPMCMHNEVIVNSMRVVTCHKHF